VLAILALAAACLAPLPDLAHTGAQPWPAVDALFQSNPRDSGFRSAGDSVQYRERRNRVVDAESLATLGRDHRADKAHVARAADKRQDVAWQMA
jgi:hypothetical protein